MDEKEKDSQLADKSRRDFVKYAASSAYAAPIVVSLPAKANLAKNVSAEANDYELNKT